MRCRFRRMQILHGDMFRVDGAWQVPLSAIGIGDASDWTAFEGDELVSASPSISCYRCGLADGRAVYFKRYVYRPGTWIRFGLRPAKPAVECWAYSRLQELGIPTLDVVALGERRRFGLLVAGAIVTRGIPGTVDLMAFARDTWCHWPQARRILQARKIGRRLLGQARVAHQAGFFHHDLKWRNVLIDGQGDPDSLVWIDAPRASRMRLRHYRGAVTDLSGLARVAMSLFSRFELMRFVHHYLGEAGSSAEAKRLFRAVQAHLGRRMPQPLDLPFPD